VEPIHTLIVIFATLISQVSLLLAFFLPLKVVILMGSPSMPSYFPQAWQIIERDHLIIALTAGALGVYLLYLLVEKIIIICAERGAQHLLEKSKKITLFDNQGEVALRTYHRYSRSLAGLIFVVLSLIFVGLLYPYLAIVTLGYGLMILTFFSLALGLRKRLHAQLSQNINGLINILGGFGFLLTFILMVVDFLAGNPPSVIVAIICLLLIRQLMLRMASSLIDMMGLFSQQHQINALFFHGHQFLPIALKEEVNYRSLLETQHRDEWIVGVLREVVGLSPVSIRSSWLQTRIANVTIFEVATFDEQGKELGSYLVKLFNNNQRTMALHEASLLVECEHLALPAPQFFGAYIVENYQCHIFGWNETKELLPSELGLKYQETALRLLTYEPPKILLENYRRSKPMLDQRLNKSMVDCLRLVTGDEVQLAILTTFQEKLCQIKLRLQSLPVQIINPDMRSDTLRRYEDGNITLIHWGKWSIEPVGAGWPVPGWQVSEKDLLRLGETSEQVRKTCTRLTLVTDADIKLAALMFYFEHLFNRQQYVNMLSLMPLILACIESNDVETYNEGDVS